MTVKERNGRKRELEQQGEYIGGGAKVYKAVGEEYARLLFLSMAQLFSDVITLGPEPLNIFLVEEFDPKYRGKEPKCPSVAAIENFTPSRDHALFLPRRPRWKRLKVISVPQVKKRLRCLAITCGYMD